MNKAKKLQQILLLWNSVYQGRGTQESWQFFFFFFGLQNKKPELNYLLV